MARWILYDWDFRKIYISELAKCVRFGIIEPWRIVEYRMTNKSVGKLDAILKNDDLQRTLDQSLLYSTYRNCFSSDSSEQFTNFLLRFGFNKLHFRGQVIDPVWQKHFKATQYNYQQFEEYLNLIRLNATVSWKNNLIIVK